MAVSPDHAAVARFWEGARKQLPPDAPEQNPHLRSIGSSKEVSDMILSVILAGEKTGTFSLPWVHVRQPEARPEIFGLSILTDFGGAPRALLRTMSLTIVPYRDIDASHTACEGKGARDLGVWRKIHWPYWAAMLKPYGLTPTEDMPVCVERFALLCPKS
jgi:uncharacterized protein YhfF